MMASRSFCHVLMDLKSAPLSKSMNHSASLILKMFSKKQDHAQRIGAVRDVSFGSAAWLGQEGPLSLEP